MYSLSVTIESVFKFWQIVSINCKFSFISYISSKFKWIKSKIIEPNPYKITYWLSYWVWHKEVLKKQIIYFVPITNYWLDQKFIVYWIIIFWDSSWSYEHPSNNLWQALIILLIFCLILRLFICGVDWPLKLSSFYISSWYRFR